MKKGLILLGMVSIFFSCGSNNQDTKGEQKEGPDIIAPTVDSTAHAPEMNTDSLVKAIDLERERIENSLKSLQRKSLPTVDLRAQIKQKWSKIDFYTQNDQVVRIKTYPYKETSHRTEEFYFQNGKLILAFIEDEGLQYEGKSGKRVGKTYYFFQDKVIKEENQTNETETSIRESDSERLLQEAKEYIELLPKN